MKDGQSFGADSVTNYLGSLSQKGGEEKMLGYHYVQVEVKRGGHLKDYRVLGRQVTCAGRRKEAREREGAGGGRERMKKVGEGKVKHHDEK